jgi:hypothetical protein
MKINKRNFPVKGTGASIRFEFRAANAGLFIDIR